MKTTRLLTLFTALILALSTYAYHFRSGNLYYNITSNTKPYTVEVTYQISNSSDNYSGLTTVAIPTEVSNEGQTYSVTSIGDYAFYKCSSLTSITIPSSVTSIGSRAFYDCSSLTSITIPESVTSIVNGAFSGTPWFNSKPDGLVYINHILYSYKGTMPANTSVTVADGTVSISAQAFSNRTGLTSITIPSSVTSIGYSAFAKTGLVSLVFNADSCADFSYSFDYPPFSGLTTLQTVTIGENVKKIPALFISGCVNVTSLTIPESVTSIGSNAFANPGLVSLVYNATNCPTATFSNLSTLNSVTIGSDVATIPTNFISGCSNVTSLIIPESVTSIGSSAFANTGLTSITIPTSVTSIGYSAFANTGLTSITIPTSVTSIGSSAFANTGLTSITIPESVTSIGVGAFSGTSLTSLVFNSTNCPTATFSNLSTLNSVTIGSDVATIPTNFISGCSNVTSLIIPESVTSIGSSAFANTGLTSITIPESVTSIGASAFKSCTGLTSFTIPESVTSIGASAFQSCTGLTSITIPTSVTSIGASAFESCTGLTSLVFNAESCADFSYNGAFYGLTSLQSVKIGETVTHIPANFISSCNNVTSVTIPESVTSIGASAFQSCTGLTSFTIPESVTSIGASAFKSCTGLTSLVFNAESCADFSYSSNYQPFGGLTTLQTVTIGENVKKIPAWFISGCVNVTSLTIPESVTSIGSSAFANTGLTSLTIPTSVTSIGVGAFSGTSLTSLVYNSTNCPTATFSNLSTLNSVTIGSDVATIPTNFISGCSNVTSLIIPESVTSIGSSAFAHTGLTSITIPESVTSIQDYTFSGCTSLTSITIPSSVTSIGKGAFSGTSLTSLVYNSTNCPTATFSNLSTLNSVTIGSDVATIPTNFISGCSNVTSLIIPESVTSIGSSAFAHTGLTSITIPESVTSIQDYTFRGCTSLTSITIPTSVTSIGASAFKSCTGLTSITIPTSVTSIGFSAFAYTGLTSITIPESVTSIGSSAFANTGLISLVFNADSCADFSYEIYTSYYPPFSELTTLQTVTIGENVKNIPAWFISGCVNVTSLTIPESVTSIGSSAFANTGLTSIIIPESVTHIGASAFDACNNITRFICESNPTIESASSLLINKSLLDTIAAPASVFAVPEIKWANCTKAIRYVKVTGGELFNDAFSVINRSYKTLNTLDLAAATNTQLADEAFKDCYSLENLQLPSSLERIGYMAVANCKNLKSVHVPASVTDIDDSAFENCRSITSLTFGDQADKSRQRSVQANSQLKRIGNWSFYNCHNLQSLTIPEGVTEIGSAAFYGCTYLQDLTLPGSLQQIGDNCFALCSKLNYITVNAMMPPTIEAKTFADVNRTIPLYVPAGSLEAYQSDIYWSEFMIVTEAPTAIKPVTIIEGVYAQNGTIVVEKDTNLPVAIYDVVGRLVVSGSSLTHYFEVPNAGVYIVKVGDQTMKVLVP